MKHNDNTDEQIEQLLEQLRARRISRSRGTEAPAHEDRDPHAERVISGSMLVGLGAAAIALYFYYRTRQSAAVITASAESISKIRAQREGEAGL